MSDCSLLILISQTNTDRPSVPKAKQRIHAKPTALVSLFVSAEKEGPPRRDGLGRPQTVSGLAGWPTRLRLARTLFRN